MFDYRRVDDFFLLNGRFMHFTITNVPGRSCFPDFVYIALVETTLFGGSYLNRAWRENEQIT